MVDEPTGSTDPADPAGDLHLGPFGSFAHDVRPGAAALLALDDGEHLGTVVGRATVTGSRSPEDALLLALEDGRVWAAASVAGERWESRTGRPWAPVSSWPLDAVSPDAVPGRIPGPRDEDRRYGALATAPTLEDLAPVRVAYAIRNALDETTPAVPLAEVPRRLRELVPALDGSGLAELASETLRMLAAVWVRVSDRDPDGGFRAWTDGRPWEQAARRLGDGLGDGAEGVWLWAPRDTTASTSAEDEAAQRAESRHRRSRSTMSDETPRGRGEERLGALLSALEKLPAYEGVAFRGCPEDAGFVRDGQVTVTTRPVAATRDAGLVRGGRALYAILLRTGRDVAPFSADRSEAEVAILPGTMLAIAEHLALPLPTGEVTVRFVAEVAPGEPATPEEVAGLKSAAVAALFNATTRESRARFTGDLG